MPLKPDKTWSLFLDRDGVINKRPEYECVKSVEDFQFIDGVKESIEWFSGIFGNIFIVTNQQGIHKKLMTSDDLQKIHDFMFSEIKNANGRIDKIYYCPALPEENSFYRKPMPGMALKAKKEFPKINFRKSIMIGDTLNDMKFGKNLKMKTVYISVNKKEISENYKLIDYAFPALIDFKNYLADFYES
ncbi:MAG: HAD-IIIA family hydrolase [Bacteroidetes bacterium]|nr:MAG: HAD-IIIA family hydrolase [Bacteroidota bacterium]